MWQCKWYGVLSLKLREENRCDLIYNEIWKAFYLNREHYLII